jgi:hypothetical protein
MEIDNWINSSRPAFLQASLQEIKKCVNCGSVFISDNSCDSCGFQFHFDPLGEPLGDRSYFSLKEDYLSEIRFKIGSKKNIFQGYLRKIVRRFELLCCYFSKENLELDLNKNGYFVEFIFLITELCNVYDHDFVVENLKTIQNIEIQRYCVQVVRSTKQSQYESKQRDSASILKYLAYAIATVIIVTISLAAYPLLF